MAQASRQDDSTDELRLEDALLYLFGKESESRDGEGIRIPLSSVHKIVKEIEPALKDLGIRLKFHEGSEVVHSKQVDEAIDNLIPYLIPIRNPSFSLDIYREVGENALSEAENELSRQQIADLEQIFESDNFRRAISTYSEGGEER